MAALPGYITPQDLVDAISETTYIAIYDDTSSGSRTTIDASGGVRSCLRRAHAEAVSWLPDLYNVLPPEVPAGITNTGTPDRIPVLLKDAELQWAILYTYRRHPEYVRTYSAEAGGSLEKSLIALMQRIQSSEQRVPSTDSPPEPSPANVGGLAIDYSPRISVQNSDGSGGSGDF